MKRTMIAILTALLTLLAGSAFTQNADVKKPSGDGKVHSITIPAIRIELADGPGRVKTETYCNICHSVDYITMQPKFPRSQWTATVNKMIKFGAPIPQEDAKTVITYLATYYGTGK